VLVVSGRCAQAASAAVAAIATIKLFFIDSSFMVMCVTPRLLELQSMASLRGITAATNPLLAGGGAPGILIAIAWHWTAN
jgi:hypothetical protein